MENGQKMRCNANKDIAQLIVNQRKKMRASSNTCVCLYGSLKLLTDDHSDLVAVKLKTDHMLLRNLRCR